MIAKDDDGTQGPSGQGDPKAWIEHWKQFVEALSEDGRRKLLANMGITVKGFRRGSKIPDQSVRAALEAEPIKYNGKRFIAWFRDRFDELVQALENDSDEELEKKRPDLVEKVPPPILRIGLLLHRPELAEAWEPALAAREDGLKQKAAEEALGDMGERLAERDARIEELKQELEAVRRENEQLASENRKLRRLEREMQQRIDKSQAEAERKINLRHEEAKKFQDLYREKVEEARSLETDLERARQDLETEAATIDRLHDRVARYKQALTEGEHLKRLYRSMARGHEPVERQPDVRVLVLGAGFSAEAFDVNGKSIHIEGVEAREEIDQELKQRCAAYHRVFLLSSCPYPFRLSAYRQLSGLTEIPSLTHIRGELGLEDGLA